MWPFKRNFELHSAKAALLTALRILLDISSMKAVQRNRAEKKVRPQNGSPIKFHGDSGAQGGGGGGPLIKLS